MTAQAPYESLTSAQIEQGWRDTFSTENPFCPCDLRTFTKAVRWAERAALPERAPVSAGGDAVAWLVRWQHGPNKKGTLAFNHEGEAREYAEWRGLGKEQWETPHWPVELIPLYATPAPPVGADWVVVPRGWAMRRHPNGSIEVSKDHHSFVVERDKSAFDARILDFLDAMLAAAPTPAEARGVGDGVRELVAKWRKQVRTILGQGPSGAAMLQCAADLEAALAANKPAGEVSDA